MASGYDFTVKLYQLHVKERVTRPVIAINILNVYCSRYTVISAKRSSTALPCKRSM